MSFRTRAGWGGLGLAAAAWLGLAVASATDASGWTVDAAWTLAAVIACAGVLAAAVRVPKGRVAFAWRLWAAGALLGLAGVAAHDLSEHTGLSLTHVDDALLVLFAAFGVAGLALRSPPGILSFHLFALDALPIVLVLAAGMRIHAGGPLGDDPVFELFLGAYAVAYALLGLIGLQMAFYYRTPNMLLVVAAFTPLAAGMLAGAEASVAGAGSAWPVLVSSAGLVVLGTAGTRRALRPDAYARLVSGPVETGARALPAAAAIVALIGLDAVGAAAPYRPLLFGLVVAAFTAFSVRFYLLRREAGRSEAALRRSEERSRRLVEQLPLVTYVDALDDVSSNLYTSPQIEAMLGYAPDEWVTDHDLFVKLLHPDDRDRVLSLIRQANAAAEPYSAEYRLVARDGSVRWFLDDTVVAFDGDGRPVQRHGFLLDVTQRHEAEEELRETTQTLQALVEASPAAIVGFDGEGNVLMWNPGAERTFGWSEEEVLGRFNPLVPEEGRDDFLRYVEQALEGRGWRDVEVVRMRKDGSQVQLSVSSAPLRDATGRVFGMVSVLLDISERTAAEEAIREREERFRTLVENIPGAVYRRAADADWTMAFLSDEIEEIAGYPASELVRNAVRSYASIIHADDLTEVGRVVEEALAARAPFIVEYRILTAGGDVRWVYEKGKPVYGPDAEAAWIDGAIFDVTERKRAEAQLARERDLMDTFMEHTPDHVFFKDEQSRFLRVSRALARWLRLESPEGALGKTDFDFFTRENAQLALEQELEIMRTGRPVLEELARETWADGRETWVSTSKLPLRRHGGDIVGTFGIARDVTENRRAEQEREELLRALADQNGQLRALDRMKDEFVALVSHELRTPLTSILGYLELLLDQEGGDLTGDQRHFLSVVERNANRLLRLVGDLLFVAQVEAGKLSIERDEIDLGSLARDCVEAAAPRATEKRLRLLLADGPVPALSGDRVRLAQLLDNLVSNAIKFTPEGGTVEVRVGGLDGRAYLAVSDTGMGIPAGEIGRLFERFYRTAAATQSAIQGTGLGLAITKAIVEAHHGTIRVESEEGAGTTFHVELPLRPESSPADPADLEEAA